MYVNCRISEKLSVTAQWQDTFAHGTLPQAKSFMPQSAHALSLRPNEHDEVMSLSWLR